MDPNKTWQEIVRLLNLPEEKQKEKEDGIDFHILATSESFIDEEETTELKNHISNLYGWIKRGGFVPRDLESLNKVGCLFVLESIWEKLGD